MLNQKVVARLRRLIFLRKILARKHATFHIQTRWQQAENKKIEKNNLHNSFDFINNRNFII